MVAAPSTYGCSLNYLRLQVALNAEHFTAQPAAPTFTRYAPPRPAALAPTAGLGNGTLVTVNGSGAWQVGLATRCRFGNAVVNATRVHAAGGDADADADADSVRCAAPPAAEAGAWARVALGFSEAWAAELQEAEAELHGAAVVVAGQLHLTTHHPAFTREGLLGADAARGSLVLSLPQPALPPRSFRASFQLRMGGGATAWSNCPLGSAPARLLCLLTARLVALGSSALPGRGRPTELPATASGARASCLQSRPFHRVWPSRHRRRRLLLLLRRPARWTHRRAARLTLSLTLTLAPTLAPALALALALTLDPSPNPDPSPSPSPSPNPNQASWARVTGYASAGARTACSGSRY